MSPNESPAAQIRERLNELRVGHMPKSHVWDHIRDYSPGAIGARDLAAGEVEIRDRVGNSWNGDADVALAALAELDPTGHAGDVWERLARALT